jgi:hypothetical protein
MTRLVVIQHIIPIVLTTTDLVESESRGRGAVAATDARTNTNNLGVDSARDAVVKLDVQLGDGVD